MNHQLDFEDSQRRQLNPAFCHGVCGKKMCPTREPGSSIKWYRTQLPKELLVELHHKDDIQGYIQTLGWLGLLLTTGVLAFVASLYLPWYLALLVFLLHGTVASFMINGFHELLHESVFRTRQLNRFFVPIFSFLGLYNHVQFWASHNEHHKYTLHPPDDLEVTAPSKGMIRKITSGFVFNFRSFTQTLSSIWNLSRGRLSGEWEHHLFDGAKPEERARLFGWARTLLVGHGLVALIAIITGYWQLVVLVTLSRFYGGWLFLLCNNLQHAGLADNVPDYRVCCRTHYLPRLVEFLYWRMNYHIEHHMYPGVPCYNLPKLHAAIKHDLPHTPSGLLEAWAEILPVLKQQETDPKVRYYPNLPAPATPQVAGD
jgi:fatty acid desaturase